jgi:hypothetical protein
MLCPPLSLIICIYKVFRVELGVLIHFCDEFRSSERECRVGGGSLVIRLARGGVSYRVQFLGSRSPFFGILHL